MPRDAHVTGPVNRRTMLRAVAGSAGLVLVSCAGPTDPPLSETGPGEAGFPRTVPGVEGPTVIPVRPRRVVSVGQYRDTDAAVALGVTPLATPDLSAFIPGGISPWVRARLAGPPPMLLDTTDGIPMEQVVGLQPDLILGTDRSALAGEYPQLRQIAPTLSSANGYNKDPWQLTTQRIGTALGDPDRATALIAQVEGAIAAARAQHPTFAGRTFTIGPVQADGTINTINSPTDASAVFLSQLGLRLSPKVTSLPQVGGFPGRTQISSEQLSTIDADVLILTYNTPAAQARIEAMPLFQSLPAVRRGSYIPVDLTTAIAVGFPSALSIPYALDQLVAKVAAALDRR